MKKLSALRSKKLVYQILSLAIVVFGFILLQSFSIFQFTAKHANKVKNGKAIVKIPYIAEKQNSEGKQNKAKGTYKVNELALESLKSSWKISGIEGEKNSRETIKFINENKNYYALSVGTHVVTKTSNNDGSGGPVIKSNYSSTGVRVDMPSGHFLAFPLPFTDEEKFINEISIKAASKSLQGLICQIETGIVKNQKDVYNNNKRNTKQLASKTLLLPELFLHNDFDLKEIHSIYKHKIEVCTYEKYKLAITEGLEGYVVPLLSTENFGEYYQEHFSLWDSKTWECIAMMRFKGIYGHNKNIFADERYKEFIKLDKAEWKRIVKRL